MSTTKVNSDADNDNDADNDSCSCSESSDTDTQNMDSSTEGGIKEIASKETKEVRQVKFIIILVLFMSVLGALVVYFISEQSEEQLFEASFYSDGNKVFQSLGKVIERSLVSLGSLATTAVNVARATNQTFPFVTYPGFAYHVAELQPMMEATVTYFNAIVRFEEREAWELYASGNNVNLPAYIKETMKFQEHYPYYYGPKPQNYSWSYADTIYQDDYEDPPFADIPYNPSRPGLYDIHIVDWQRFPLVMTSYHPANWDWYSRQYPEAMTRMIKNKKAVISEPLMIPRPDNPVALAEAQLWCDYFKDYIPPDENCMEPTSTLYYPIIPNEFGIDPDNTESEPDELNGVKAMIAQELYWRSLTKNILPATSKGIVLVFSNDCVEDSFTYQIDGPNSTYLGVGDLHDHKYNGTSIRTTMSELSNYASDSRYVGLPIDDEACTFTFDVYPSDEMKSGMQTNQGVIFAVSAVAFIVLPFMVFLAYERRVSQQQKLLMSSAQRSNAIVDSLFPSNVRDKLYVTGNNDKNVEGQNSAPIADLYPETTVLFADISNFTVWSSVRDPYAVFTLLETVYSTFDEIANRRNVFKVETIGDCYVAVTGLPKPRRHHAAVMAKFAQEIISSMRVATTELETQLGPGTSTLAIRVGLNSGPTTAGVLRGSKGRFQLFGDTVNTAARMETNSIPGKILCTQKTADLLIAAGKQHWLQERTDLVNAKGKGQMRCYWCSPKTSGQMSVNSGSSGDQTTSISSHKIIVDDKATLERLVGWVTKLFEDALEKIAVSVQDPRDVTADQSLVFSFPRSEVSESIVLLGSCVGQHEAPGVKCKVTEAVKTQLHQIISSIAMLYRNNDFHNFEHACHVVMTTKKLLSRVIKPTESSASATSYGLTSDPLTHFGILFSALVHDVDHPGVSNAQLIKETNELAVKYNNQSVAEQNSVTLAWELLMQPQFIDLREAIAGSERNLARLRQIVVNSVIATDLFDPELRSFRENRWKKAFEQSPETVAHDSDDVQSSLRAAIVIEHIIQASDVSHTMQHWHVYQKWNQRLFREMYTAYATGRAEKDPSNGWYEGELWFFDNYIIPLAKKLKTCGVFGVSCDELLDYANDNRFEWEAKGRDIVAQFLADIRESDCLTIDHTPNRFKVANALEIVSSTVDGKVANEGPAANNTSHESLSSL